MGIVSAEFSAKKTQNTGIGYHSDVLGVSFVFNGTSSHVTKSGGKQFKL